MFILSVHSLLLIPGQGFETIKNFVVYKSLIPGDCDKTSTLIVNYDSKYIDI